MNFYTCLLIWLCIASAQTILLPLRSGGTKCMISYSVGDSSSVKIGIQLPSLQLQQQGEHYLLKWTNINNNLLIYTEGHSGGKIIKEFEINSQHVYEFCIDLISSRPQTVEIDYEVDQFYQAASAETKLPASMLHRTDLQPTNWHTYQVGVIASSIMGSQKKREAQTKETFQATVVAAKRTYFWSLIQVILVLATGLIQFWLLYRKLDGKGL